MPRRDKPTREPTRRRHAVAIPDELPVLPTGAEVAFLDLPLSVAITSESAAQAVDEAMAGDRLLAAFAQIDPTQPPTTDNLYPVGTAATITHITRDEDDSIHVIITGQRLLRRTEFTQDEPFLIVKVQPIAETTGRTAEITALQRNLMDLFERAVLRSPSLSKDMVTIANGIQKPRQLADYVATSLNIGLTEKQDLLETTDVAERLRKMNAFATSELEIIELEQRIKEQMRASIDHTQREYYLREQMRAIQRELGEGDGRVSEVSQLRDSLEKAHLPPEAWQEAQRELDRLAKMPPAAVEQNVITTYIEWLSALPWSRSTADSLDIDHARRVLDEDHYDVERVKDRILDYLAVAKLRRQVKGPILAFIGPAGVGKTSLGHSIARSLGRAFVRVSLGGIRDEAEIRGHRRTYVAAMPGRIIQGLRRAGSNNPVFMLDEIDKLAVSFQGDPAAALLEVLDPAQNSAFTDLYIGVPFDLSLVMFIATGNMTDTIPPALLDRMEVIYLSGYMEQDKVQIARRFLVPRQIVENGLRPDQIEITDDALTTIVRDYTQESGVRNLERVVATICRRVARKIAEGHQEKTIVTVPNLPDYLGPPRCKFEMAGKKDEIGTATGLAWTASGGALMPVEVSVVPGNGKLILTGQLGEVMRESGMAAVTYTRGRAAALGVRDDFFERNDIHVHLPAGAIPKDGPSAGVTMATALISALTHHPVAKEIGMTGEVTLRGKVMPVGGVREKVLAGYRAGLKTLILPQDNKVDVDEVRGEAKKELNFIFVEHMDEVLTNSLKSEKRDDMVPVVFHGPPTTAAPRASTRSAKRRR